MPGGGNNEKQIEELVNIAKFIGINVNQNRIVEIASQLWGTSKNASPFNYSFRTGKLGRWREFFTQRNIEEFKAYWNDYLVNWGYEDDANW